MNAYYCKIGETKHNLYLLDKGNRGSITAYYWNDPKRLRLAVVPTLTLEWISSSSNCHPYILTAADALTLLELIPKFNTISNRERHLKEIIYQQFIKEYM